VSELGLTEWRLSNGARVLLKPTDFKEDQVLFAAFSPGGDSLVADRDYVSAVTAATIVDESGLDGFDAVQLRKKLAGRAVDTPDRELRLQRAGPAHRLEVLRSW
jgi:zinc protease